ncbi:hypothetical protein [Aliikangiella sp. IMCC44359]|uniref:hypothetical protein n=1 Tax=Aliikangiella sp. IMCC44359 TaxID=3459125 RepID=UPI00403B0AC5
MTKILTREEMLEKLEEAKKEMKKKGRNYDGLGKAIAELNKENGEDYGGVILGAQNEVDFYRILKEIKENAVDE